MAHDTERRPNSGLPLPPACKAAPASGTCVVQNVRRRAHDGCADAGQSDPYADERASAGGCVAGAIAEAAS